MSKQKYRTIEVDGQKFQWKVGRSFVKIQGMEAVPNSMENPFPGAVPCVVRDKEDGEDYDVFAVGPKQIADYIRSQVSGA